MALHLVAALLLAADAAARLGRLRSRRFPCRRGPLVPRDAGPGRRVIRSLGSGEVCSDYVGILCRPGVEATAIETLADFLTPTEANDPSLPAWDMLQLDGVEAEDGLACGLVARLAERGCATHRRAMPSCWRIELPRSWEEYLAGLSKSHRKQIRRLERELLDTGRAVLHTVERAEDLPQAAAVLIDLHQRRRRWLGQRGCFSSPRFAAFHREVMPAMLAQGQLQLHWLELDGRPAAAEYHLAGGGVIYAYQSGIDPAQLDAEPGRLITTALLRRAIRQGFSGLRLPSRRRAVQGPFSRRAAADARPSRRRRPALGPPAAHPLAGRRQRQTMDQMMDAWKTPLLGLYYEASLPLRWWNRRRAAARGRSPICVLFYHRIADDRANSWTISHDLFARQIGWLQKHFEMISLAEAQRRIRSGANSRPAVSVTFDDGYAENCRRAIPLLVKERIPCTYFVTARNVLEGEPFPHDLAGGNRFAPNNVEQLQAMAAAGIEIGAHSYTHADLGLVADPRQLRFEVVAAEGGSAGGGGPAGPLLRLPLRLPRASEPATPSPWPPSAAMRRSARPTAATTSPATTPSTCNAFVPETT